MVSAQKNTKSVTKVSVAEFLRQQIALSDKSQREIATDVGYQNPNVITMIKQGHTRLPIDKVGLFAKALGLDPRYLLRITMQEYMPQTWEVIAEVLGDDINLSQEELNVLGIVRQANNGLMPNMASEENRAEITQAIRNCIARDQAKNRASVVALESLPKNARKK